MSTDLPPPASPAPSRQTAGRLEVRASLRLLGRALVVYGIVGLVLGALGLSLAVGIWVRSGAASGSLGPRLATLGGSLEAVADALEDAAASSRTAALTIETTTPAIDGLAGTVDATAPTLAGMGGALERLTFLGTRPLADAGRRFSKLGGDLRDLGPQLRDLTDGLAPNAATLRRTADSMGRVASELRAAGSLLDGGLAGGLLGLVTFLAAALLAWLVAPAVGALLLGRWLLRRAERLARVSPRSSP